MEVGPTGAQFGYSESNDVRYCSQFDGREIVRRAAAAHSQYLVLWARDGDYAYHDSKLLLKAPGLGTRDPLRDAVDEARQHRIPLLAYCVVQQGGHFLKAHPEWEMRDEDGKPVGRFCYNSGYLEAMKQIVAEELAYGIDGFHLDMLDQGFGPPYGCWCTTCQSLFEKQFGKKMPKGVTWNEDWERMLEFRYQASEHFEQALYAHIKSLNPSASVDFNYHGNPPFSWEVGQLPVRHAGNADFVTGETGMWGFSAITVGLNAEFYRAATPGRPVQVAISRDARVYHNQTVRPLADLRWELLGLLAHGAFVTVVDKTAFDGGLDPLAYERVGAAFADALARREHFGQKATVEVVGQASRLSAGRLALETSNAGGTPGETGGTPAPLPQQLGPKTVAEVGLYFSSRTRDWFAREKPEDYFQSFLGAHKALVYEHIPWGVILDENVTLPLLKQFPIVMLPGVAILSDNEVELLNRYVSEGGKLIVTGLSGCCDRWGKVQGKSSIESLTGARFVSKLDSMDNWVRFTGSQASSHKNQFAPNGRLDWPFLVKGPAVIYEATSAEPVGELMKPYRTVRQQQGKEGTQWPMSAEAAVGPAILVNQLGKGTVVTFAGSPDFATASEHHIVETRKLLRNAVRFLDPAPRIEIAAPANVEAVVTDDPATRTLRVHFIAYNSPPQSMPAKNRPYVLPGLIEDAPIYRATITLRDRPKHVGVFNKSTELRHSGRKVELRIEEIHDVVMIYY